MKTALAVLFSLIPFVALADANSDAFNAGASYGKGNASQGTGSLKNPGTVTGSIPGYTSSPPESGYYGGVTGGDGGLSDKGQAALGNSDAGQSVIDSGIKNPLPVIDPNAPFITAGKGAESSAGDIINGTSQQCTQTTVGKSVFENYTCSADAYVQKTCTRDTGISGHYEMTTGTKTVFFTSQSDQIAISVSGGVVYGAVTLPENAVLVSAHLHYHSILGYKVQVIYGAQEWEMYVKNAKYTNFDYDLSVAGQSVQAGDKLTVTMKPNSRLASGMANSISGNKSTTMDLTVTYQTSVQTWVPTTSSPAVCASNPGGTLVSSVCSIPGGTRQTVVDGVVHNVYSDCWQYTDTYRVSENTQGTCASLISNPSCTQAGSTCVETIDGMCAHIQYVYQCQKVFYSSGLLCGGQYFCQTGNCSDTEGAGDSGFDVAVAKLAGLASAADDVKNDTVNVKAFTGKAMSCRKAFAGFSNCCKDSGWGQDTGLAACNSDEMAIGQAKQKKVTVSIGDRCDREVLGVCVQKSRVYCVFDGKLARIIQEQGRRDQLGIGFGSGNSPNCSGITVPQLQAINFDLINFSDFYSDLMNNQKIPDTSTQVKLIKDRIAAQVNQQGGK